MCVYMRNVYTRYTCTHANDLGVYTPNLFVQEGEKFTMNAIEICLSSND